MCVCVHVCMWVRESISPSGNHDVVREKKGLLVNTGHGVSSLERKKQSKPCRLLPTPFLAVPSLFIDHSCERFEQPEFFSLLLLLANILWIPYFLVRFFPPSFSLSLTPPPLPHSFFCPRSFRRFWEARWLGDEKKSLVFFADLLLSRMLMSSFDVLFCPLFSPPFFFFVGVTVSNGSLNFLNMRSLFIYRYLIYRWKYINSNSDAILFSFFFFHFHRENISRMILEISRSRFYSLEGYFISVIFVQMHSATYSCAIHRRIHAHNSV